VSAGVAVLERPEGSLQDSVPDTDALSTAIDFGWESEVGEARKTMAPGTELVEVVKDAGRVIRPDLSEADLSSRATEIAAELQSDRRSRRADLRRTAAEVRATLERKSGTGTAESSGIS
jgi:hypothetical protein